MAHIVVIDDSPTEVYVLQTMLERNGHQVSVAKNAEEGIALVKQAQPNAVLMDVVMPGMNGFQATRELNKNPETSHIPVIIVTTKDQQTDKIWGMRQGAKDYLVKPVKEADLMSILTTVLH
ncbi:response regulator [Halothiobacillus sp.]|uniref:response regulator n=1 Tax=Halothiobacillus sp. TaxID=1891311 RepID=UPI0019C74764|nr:response regulator [Halothiobacillus sp.]MBD3815257.1 response regulator [Halothiobacillus sp.]MDD3577172.1 response regulator [Halothiobacillus sp.]MDD4965786.1 response regulator [Halothiobacillus sp.]MDY0146914.1 response regulator [Halothiobacillus sp.]